VRPFMMLALTLLAACAASTGRPARTPEQHAANIAAAQRAGYTVETHGEYTKFCPIASATGSHMGPTCISESDFEASLGPPRSTSSAGHYTNTPPGPGPNAGH
jgi:hypothetical protein